jgi:hypothetical protein
MQIEATQTSRPGRSDALGAAALIAVARLDWLVRTRAQRASRPAMIGVGLLTAAIAAVAYLRGADVHAGRTGGQPGLLPNLALASVAKDDRARGPQ